jgi:hypothetical protein
MVMDVPAIHTVARCTMYSTASRRQHGRVDLRSGQNVVAGEGLESVGAARSHILGSMSAVIHYQTMDDRGEEILDELERSRKTSSDRLPAGERIYFLVNESPGDLVISLDEIDLDWREHIGRLTA